MKLSEIASKLACRLEGDPDVDVTGVTGIDQLQFATPGARSDGSWSGG